MSSDLDETLPAAKGGATGSEDLTLPAAGSDDVTRRLGAPTMAQPGGGEEPESGDAGPRKTGVGIRTQIFLAAAALVLLTLGSAVLVTTWRANAVAEKAIWEALTKVPSIFENYRATLESQVEDKLTSIAAAAGTKALFAQADAPTRWVWATDVARDHGAKTVFLFDRASGVLARSDKPQGEEQRIGQPFGRVSWVGEVLDGRRPQVAAIREQEVLSLVGSVPVFSGEGDAAVLNGVLAATFPLAATEAVELQGLTRGEVAFVADVSKRDDPPSLVLAGATEGFAPSGLLEVLADHGDFQSAVFEQARSFGPFDLDLGGDHRVVLAIPVATASGEAVGALVVSRSRAEETAAFRQIRNTLLAVGAVGFLLAIPLALVVGQRIARPVELLAASAQSIRDGELSVELPRKGSGEVGALARAFAEMVEELQEKQALEELVAEFQRRPGDATRVSPGEGGASPTEPGRGPQLGELFASRYEILSPLGSGGMATVFRANDRELDDEVALKVLRTEALPHGTQADQSLKQEIRLARKITHANVCRVHDLGDSDGVRYITMEYVPGMTLRELLDRRGALAYGPGLQISKQLCRGLAAVHEAGIIHRDIKPPNIMVLPNGVVKLMDFGISLASEGKDSTAGMIVGTPFYMSPEQARGVPLDLRSDIYTVGLVMFEIFTGAKPFQGKDPTAIMTKRITHDAPPPSQFRPDLPAALEAIIVGCMARPPEQRPASAAELYQALVHL